MAHNEIGYHIKEALIACQKYLKKEFPSLEIVPVELEIPKDKQHGDLTTNLAFKLSGALRQKPEKTARLLAACLERTAEGKDFFGLLDKIEVKHPGFINFWFGREYLYGVLREIETGGTRFGASDIGEGRKVQIEFVSANPTGPLTVAHGRQAAVGDSLANILEFINYKVQREYYINDEGSQIGLLGESIRARYFQALGRDAVFPENGYKGRYIFDIANSIMEEHGDRHIDSPLSYFADMGVKSILMVIKDDLGRFGVNFDVWFSQRNLAKKGLIKRALDRLEKRGYLYKKDGALWFKSQALGDDKDRVVMKSDGTYTYLAPDIAYHDDKFKRGFKRVIDIWGPDHHGYIPRLKAAVGALGYDEDSLSVLLVQLATLYRGDKIIPMSTRGGQFITLREVIQEVGGDVARFFFLMRKTDSHLDFDLELAKKTSFDNPVYYIQYGYARIANILEFARKEYPHYTTESDPKLLVSAEEIDILKELRKFPYIIRAAARTMEPYSLVSYTQDLAALFHRFYTAHRVVTSDMPLSCARLRLVSCVKAVLAQCLSLLGITAPEKM